MMTKLFTAKIDKIQDKGNAFKVTFQSPPDGFDLKPGQYIEVYSDNDSGLKKPLYLAATLASKRPGFFKVNAGKPQDPAVEREWLFLQAQEEEKMQIRGPFGRAFPLEKIENHPLLLIIAGSGFASVQSIFSRLLENEHTKLLYTAKTLHDIQWMKKVKMLATQDKNYITLTREEVALEGFKFGRLNQHLSSMPITEDTRVFICGPTGFLRDMSQILLDKQLEMANIHVILNTILPGKEDMCPIFSLDELSDDEILHAIGLKYSRLDLEPQQINRI
ncbi:MAG: FAD-dependent oxidoreductase [Legionella sp.]|nr:FAD-dependent oxidoreductase [Legionella sp.]